MSGIVGIFNLDGAPVDQVLLHRMTARMAFRGPDAQDTWLDGPAGLGHALLRTTFEAAREQGPCSLDGQTWITVDARVDGRADLIGKLRAQGLNPQDDDPDPLLILYAYRAWGERCLEHLIGDFGFAIWDAGRQRLFCARDQIGIVPFFYAQVGHSLIVSNTLLAVRLHPQVSDTLNERTIGDYLLFRGNQDMNTTTFADVRRLPPAHSLTWSAAEGLRIRRYWSLTPAEEREFVRYKNPGDYVDRFRELFQQAVVDRLRTDQVTIAMSGGMDSPAVAAAARQSQAKQGQPRDLLAFTFTHTLVPHQEKHYAGLVAEALRIPIRYLDNDARLLKEPPKPPIRALSPELNMVFTWWLNPWGDLWAQMVTAGRVLLTGHGGDALGRSSRTYWMNLLKRGKWVQMAIDMLQYKRSYGRRPTLFLRPSSQPRIERTFPVWLDSDFAARLGLRERLQEQTGQVRDFDNINSMTINPVWSNMLTSFDPGNTLLPFKARFPFMDLRLVDYLAVVPPVPWFERKRLLREAMRDALPKEVCERPKTLMSALPIQALTSQQGVPAYLEELAYAPELVPYVNRDALLQLVRTPDSTETQFMSSLHPAILAYWLRHRHEVE